MSGGTLHMFLFLFCFFVFKKKKKPHTQSIYFFFYYQSIISRVQQTFHIILKNLYGFIVILKDGWGAALSLHM